MIFIKIDFYNRIIFLFGLYQFFYICMFILKSKHLYSVLYKVITSMEVNVMFASLHRVCFHCWVRINPTPMI